VEHLKFQPLRGTDHTNFPIRSPEAPENRCFGGNYIACNSLKCVNFRFVSSPLIGAARQALTKLGVPWEPSEAERDYNEGRSAQIPLNPVVRVKGRFSRRLRDGKQELVIAR